MSQHDICTNGNSVVHYARVVKHLERRHVGEIDFFLLPSLKGDGVIFKELFRLVIMNGIIAAHITEE